MRITTRVRATSSPPRTTRWTRTWSRRVKRVVPRACSRRWRPASRWCRRGSGRRRRSSTTVATGCLPRWTTSKRSRRPSEGFTRTRRSGSAFAPRVGRQPRPTPTSDSTRAGPSCSTASRRGTARVSIDRVRVGRYARAASRWARLLVRGRPAPGLRVFYGHDRVPAPGEAVAGGTAKFQRLAARFPNRPAAFSCLYLGTTWLPRDLGPLLAVARRRRIPLVLNQDGVAYPGWAGAATEAINRSYRRALLAAEHVLYQSEFSKRSADEFLGEPNGSWEVLYNAVDVEHFTPVAAPPEDGPVFLLGGDQTQAYRLALALRHFAVGAGAEPTARLLVTRRLVSPPEALLDDLRL